MDATEIGWAYQRYLEEEPEFQPKCSHGGSVSTVSRIFECDDHVAGEIIRRGCELARDASEAYSAADPVTIAFVTGVMMGTGVERYGENT